MVDENIGFKIYNYKLSLRTKPTRLQKQTNALNALKFRREFQWFDDSEGLFVS